jgi:hypothetical protein
MIIPLAGGAYLLENLATLPLPIDRIQSCDSTFFINNGFTDDEMSRRIGHIQESVENVSRSNVFLVEIERIKPEGGWLWDSVAVGGFLSMFAVSATVNMDFYGLGEAKAGTGNIKHFDKKESGDIEISFFSPTQNLAKAYFFEDSDSNPIIPTDGTALLATEYYFKIKVWKWAITEGVRTKAWYVDDYYHVNSNISIGFDANSEELQTFSITFKKMDTGGILER